MLYSFLGGKLKFLENFTVSLIVTTMVSGVGMQVKRPERTGSISLLHWGSCLKSIIKRMNKTEKPSYKLFPQIRTRASADLTACVALQDTLLENINHSLFSFHLMFKIL